MAECLFMLSVTGQIPAPNAPERIFTSLTPTKKESAKISPKRDAVTLKRHLQQGTVGVRDGGGEVNPGTARA